MKTDENEYQDPLPPRHPPPHYAKIIIVILFQTLLFVYTIHRPKSKTPFDKSNSPFVYPLIPQQMFSLFHSYLAARDDIDQRGTSAVNNNNLQALPLIHSHDGGKTTCPVSIRNQKKIRAAEELIASRKARLLGQRDILNREIFGWEKKLENANVPDRSAVTQSPEYRKLEDRVTTLTQQYDDKLQGLQNNRHDVLNKYRHLKQHPANMTVENLNKDISTLQSKLSRLLNDKDRNAHVFADEVNARSKHLDSLSFNYKQQLSDIDNKIKNLSRPNSATQRDISILNPQLKKFDADRTALERQYQADVITIKNQHNNLLTDYLNSFTSMAKKYNVLNNNIANHENKRKNIESNLDTIRRGGNSDEINLWTTRQKDADTEVKNCTEKLNLLKAKADQELKKLNEINQEHLANYKKQIQIEKDNRAKIIGEQINELNYNSKNTMVQVEFANVCNRPVLMSTGFVDEVNWVPVVSQRPAEVPVVTPQSNYFYRHQNDVAKPYTPHAVKLTPIPDLNTSTMHSTSVPRILVEQNEVTEMVEKVVEVPKTTTNVKEVVTERVIPGKVITQRAHIDDILDSRQLHQATINVTPADFTTTRR